MIDRIKLTEEDIHVINHFGHYRVKFKSLEGDDIEWTISEAQQLKQQILDDQEKSDRLTKEIAYAHWKEEIYEKLTGDKDHETINDGILATLQLIEGTHSHDPNYDEEFERQYDG